MKALIIEDETIIRTGIVNKVAWEKFQIFQVIEADNGEAGYEITVSEKRLQLLSRQLNL